MHILMLPVLPWIIAADYVMVGVGAYAAFVSACNGNNGYTRGYNNN